MLIFRLTCRKTRSCWPVAKSASQDAILHSLFRTAVGYPVALEAIDIQQCEALRSQLRNILFGNLMKNVTLEEQKRSTGKPEVFVEKWLSLLRDEKTDWPEQCARPVNLDDYRRTWWYQF